MTTKAYLLMCLAAIALAGCETAVPGKPYATSETVLQQQFAAHGAQGGMVGDEAGHITTHYQQQIGMPPAPSGQSGAVTGAAAGMTGAGGAH